MSEAARAGREPPPVRLETVATATGLRSPATRLRDGDAPSPFPAPRGATAPGRAGGRTVGMGGGRRASLRPGKVCLPTSRSGVGVGASASVGTSWLPRGCSRRSGAPGVAASVEETQTPGACRGRRGLEAGPGIRGPEPPHHRYHRWGFLPPGGPPAGHRAWSSCIPQGAMFLTGGEEGGSHLSSSRPRRVPKPPPPPRGAGSGSPQEGCPGRAGAEERTLLTQGSRGPGQMGATQSIVWITSVPFLWEHNA